MSPNLRTATKYALDILRRLAKGDGSLGSAHKKKARLASHKLTERQREVYTLIRVQNLTLAQAALKMKCSKQNVGEHLKKAEIKVKASGSRSISAKDTTVLPTDRRGQIAVGDGSTSEITQKHSRRKM